MSNHLSFLDGPLLMTVLDRPARVIVKRFVFRVPVLGLGMRFAGYVPLDKEGAGEGRKEHRPGGRADQEKSATRSSSIPRGRGAGTASSCRSAEAASSWPSLRGAHRPGVDPGDL